MRLPPNNNHPLWLSRIALRHRVPLPSSNRCLVTLDINRAVFLINVEFSQRIRRRRILDITTLDIKTSYSYYHLFYSKRDRDIPPCHGQVILPSGATTPDFNGAP